MESWPHSNVDASGACPVIWHAPGCGDGDGDGDGVEPVVGSVGVADSFLITSGSLGLHCRSEGPSVALRFDALSFSSGRT